MKRRPWKPEVLTAVLLFLLSGCAGAPPAPPAAASAQVSGGGEVTVSWSGGDAANTFRLYRRSGGERDFKYLCDVEGTRYLDLDVEYGESYTYMVESFDGHQTSHSGAVTAPLTMWSKAELLSVDCALAGTARLSWADASASAYRIYGSHDGAAWTLLDQTEALSYTLEDTGLSFVSVAAVYEGDEGPRSEAAALLAAPELKTLSRMDKYTMVLEYSPVAGAERYDIYRALTPEGPYTLVDTSYDTVYYDASGEGIGAFYKVQPRSALAAGPLSASSEGLPAYPSAVSVPILMYHEFVTREDLDGGVLFDEYAIWKDEFEADLIYLRDNGYTTITTRQLIDFLNGQGTLPAKPVILSIDDGKLGVYKHASPLLAEYGMQASMAVIGEKIDSATADPENRVSPEAPYCTWEEIAALSTSGTVEITSHSYGRHRYNHTSGHRGANALPGESDEDFYQTAIRDYDLISSRLETYTGAPALALSYPYSERGERADRVWLRCGYRLLLAGDGSDVRPTHSNFFLPELGVNHYSAPVRRLVRMTGTPISVYLENAISHDAW